MSNRRAFKTGLYALSVAAGVLLFVGGPDYYAPRVARLAWDLGHLPAFFVWTTAALATTPRFAAKSVGSQLLIALPIVLLLGLGIEGAQSMLGRSFELRDIENDVLGNTAAIVFPSPTRLEMRKISLLVMQVLVVAFIILQLLPLARPVTDDVIAWKQFPVLADFEMPFELTRWTSRSTISIDHKIARQGRASLRVPFIIGQYSGASLQHFPSDWEGYTALHLSIYSESGDPYVISVSIYDTQHIETGRAYSDRFTGRFTLRHGWNDIDVPLIQVRKAPARRALDLHLVRDLSVIAVWLPAPGVIYIDDIRSKM